MDSTVAADRQSVRGGGAVDDEGGGEEDRLLSASDAEETVDNTDDAAADGSHQIGLSGWFFITSLFAVNLLNYMDRFTIAGVLPQVQSDFRIGDADAGLLQTVFVIVYMVVAPLFGYLGDRYSRKWIMVTGLAVWSSAVLFSSFVPTEWFLLFVASRAVVGFGEASYATVSPSLIGDRFSQSKTRSFMLMVFYVGVPIGSGFGFIVGSKMSEAAGNDWRWGVRPTPLLGLICLVIIILFFRDPQRQHCMKEEGSSSAGYRDDLKHLAKNRTYVWTTAAFTGVVFAVGSLSWWTPSAVKYAVQMQTAIHMDKATVSLIFGGITCASGLLGVASGSIWASHWKKTNQKADSFVCAIGALTSVPCLYLALVVFPANLILGWVLMFVTVTLLCLNWAVVVDMLLYVVIPTRRSTATAFQMLSSHLFGDAFSPYLIGLVSDAIRGRRERPTDHFRSLQYALFVPVFVLALAGAAFLVSSYYVVDDWRRADTQIAAADEKPTDITARGHSNESLANSD